jgi:hypothetical protein
MNKFAAAPYSNLHIHHSLALTEESEMKPEPPEKFTTFAPARQ